MRVNWRLPDKLKIHFNKELEGHKSELRKNNFQLAWRKLERAHIIGQPWAFEHTYVHWLMLKFGIRIKHWKEVFGRVPRLVAGGIKSFIGEIPVGNTGGADVSPLKPMEIPADLKTVMAPYVEAKRKDTKRLI